MTNLYLSSSDELSQYRKIGEGPKSPTTIDSKGKSYNLSGKYSVEAKHAGSLRLKACLLIICSIGFALCSEKVREAIKGRKVKIIYLERSESINSRDVASVIKNNFLDDPAGSLKSFQNEPAMFTKKVFDPISMPIRINEEMITVNKLKKLIYKHAVNDKEIIAAFKEGKTSYGKPIISNRKESKEFIQKTRQVMTFISKQDEVTQSRFLCRINDSISGCEIGRVMVIRQIYEEIFFNENIVNFENNIRMKLYLLKKTLLETMVNEKNDVQDEQTNPHMLAAYIHALGKDLGLDGVEEAKEEWFHVEIPQGLQKFEKLLNESLDEFCHGIAVEINNPNENITAKYGKFIAERVKNKELPCNFAFYDEDKKAMGLYDKLNEPSEDQESFLQLFTSPAEVKQLLAMLGYIILVDSD